jgi:urea transport system ATP-binding protein
VLLLDEPTEGIQPSIIKDIANVLNEIKKMRDITIIVSEQVLSFTMAIADRIIVIDKGNFIHEDMRDAVDTDQIKKYLSV